MARFFRSGSFSSSAALSEDGDGNDQQRLLDQEDDELDMEGDFEPPEAGSMNRHRHSLVPELGGIPRRSSFITSIGDIGGVNSIRSFTRSWQRAAAFQEVVPHRPSFVFISDEPPAGHEQGQDGEQAQEESAEAGAENEEDGPARQPRNRLESGSPARGGAGASLLGRHFEAHRRAGVGSPPPHSNLNNILRQSNSQSDFRERERKAFDAELGGHAYSSSPTRTSLFTFPPHLATPPLVGSFGSYRSYGTIQSGPRVRPEMMWDPDTCDDEDRPPILLHGVEQNGETVIRVMGQSTLPQTINNSTNALIGVGILSLPLAFKYSGWIPGLLMLTCFAMVTAHTTKLLAKCMEPHPQVITFSDIAELCWGERIGKAVVSPLFMCELVAANVALVVLFADSMEMIFPGTFALNTWKAVFCLVLLPLNTMPLRVLSYTSIIGIMSTFFIVMTVFIDGCIKQEQPGSLISPAKTYLFPENWKALPLACGLFLSPFAAHSVLPSIYRDMRHPRKFPKAIKVTFSFTYTVDLAMAVIGILMFGDGVREEITSNIIETSGYPKIFTYFMCIFIAIIPLSKVPLNSRPLIDSAEMVCRVHGHYHQHSESSSPSHKLWTSIIRHLIPVVIVLTYLVISIIFPSFDTILSLMGSLLCATISVILPVLFYLKLFGKEISYRERLASYGLIAVFSVVAIVGTAFNVIPKHILGVE